MCVAREIERGREREREREREKKNVGLYKMLAARNGKTRARKIERMREKLWREREFSDGKEKNLRRKLVLA